MRIRISVWLLLVATHLAAGVWAATGDADRVAALVAGSIYLPLWPLASVGAPVLASGGWLFSPPTALGWIVVGLVWLAVYWYAAALIVRIVARDQRATQKTTRTP